MIQTYQQFWNCGSRKLGQGWDRADKEVANFRFFPKTNILYKYNNFWSMRSSQSGLFILVDYPLTSNLEVREIYYYIYWRTYIFRKIGAWVFLCLIHSHVCGQENWFQIWSTEDFSVNNHWNPTLSIAQDIIHEVRNLLF